MLGRFFGIKELPVYFGISESEVSKVEYTCSFHVSGILLVRNVSKQYTQLLAEVQG